jgi:hypothetical protein
MLIERELVVNAIEPDSLDINPRGSGCYSGFCSPVPDHRFHEPVYAAGFKYQICGACGTVRISEMVPQKGLDYVESAVAVHGALCESQERQLDSMPQRGLDDE